MAGDGGTVARDGVAQAVRIAGPRLEHAAAAGHRMDQQLRRCRRPAQGRWPRDARWHIVRQDHEQVPVAGVVTVAAGAAAEQQHGVRTRQRDDAVYCRLEPWVQARRDLTYQ